MEETHKCLGCERQIRGHRPFCLLCQSRLRKEQICIWCGAAAAMGTAVCYALVDKARANHMPYSIRAGSHSIKIYDASMCQDCSPVAAQVIAEEIRAIRVASLSFTGYRPASYRENVYETKHGRD